MTSLDLTDANIEKLAELFPSVVTEALDADDNPKKTVDFDLLRQELSSHIVDGPQERYQLDWPGKRAAAFAANAPITKTLRPIREESVDFDSTKNLFIEGDNLDALKLLQESYLGKVKLIYIDPPYNTGNDFVYDDDFAESTAAYLERSGQSTDAGVRLVGNTESNGRFHSDWLSMMLPRLKLARRLMADNGVLIASIDDSELPRLVQLCDEVFGAQNHVETFVWKRRYGGGAKERHIASIHEYLVVYARDLSSLEDLYVDLSEEQVKRYFRQTDDNLMTRGPYRTQPLEPAASMGDRPNLNYPIAAPDGSEIWPKRQWLWSAERVLDAAARGELEFKQTNGQWQVSIKQYLNGENGTRRKTKATSIVEGIYGQNGSSEIKKLFDGKDVFPFAKPAALLQHLIDIFAQRESIVMDFFAGSGSTAHGVMLQSAADGIARQCISIQIQEICDPSSTAAKMGYETIADLAKERIRRSGAVVAGAKAHIDWNRDLGFRVLKVDTTNMADVMRTPDETDQLALDLLEGSVKPGRSGEDLLFQVMLDWGLELSMAIAVELVEGHEVFVVEDGALIACFERTVSPECIRSIAEREPLRAVFRDSGFASDDARINADQVFREMSPATDVKAI